MGVTKKIVISIFIIIFLASVVAFFIFFPILRDFISNNFINVALQDNNEIKNDISNLSDISLDNSLNDNEEIKEDIIKEIKIYDIEDGYLNVPYNPNVSNHLYNWNKLNKSQKYYQYNDSNYESKFGIDVSEFQGEIDWKKVKNSGVEFAFIRLGYRGYAGKGKLVIDSKFYENIDQAASNGIDVGVYFFSQAINEKEAIQEASFVLENIKDKNVTYPICFDLEKIKFDKARTDNLTSEQITNISIAFCKEVENAGYSSMIYGNSKSFTTRMKLEELNNYKKWYADYQDIPLYPYEFNFWQYSEKGRVNGISTNVDLNLEFVSKFK